MTLYLTPDKKHVITGYMYDAQGNNLSEKLINDELYIPAGREMWKTLDQAKGIHEGSEQAACKVVVFADPFCPYCHKFWEQAQPYLNDKSISLKTLLVGVIRPDSGATPPRCWAPTIRKKPGRILKAQPGKTNRRYRRKRRLRPLSRFSITSS
ncbi:Thiol:disulfide interchange protein DsbG precursor [Cronobacter sakazakii 701]|nr:Thiol:disulfide interchange protein DsbG precursor [Cronobacter sakazakii 701]